MAERQTLHILTRAQIASANPYAAWEDPDGLAAINPRKMAALFANPSLGGDGDPMQIIGTLGNRVVGRIDLVPCQIVVRGVPTRVFYGSDLFVPEQFRGSLMGVMLILKAQGVHETVGASGPSQIATAIYEKLKWFDIPLARFIMLRNSRPVVQRYYGDRVGLGLLAALANGALGVHRGLLALWNGPRLSGFRCSAAETLPAEAVALLDSPGRPVRGARSAAWIDWVLKHAFSDDPQRAHELFLVRDRQERLLGYFVLKTRFYPVATHRDFKNVLLGSLQDWRIFDEKILGLRDVVLLATRELVQRRVDAVEICLQDPARAGPLRPLGFVRVGSMHMLFKAGPKSPLAEAELQKPEAWDLRPADGESVFG